MHVQVRVIKGQLAGLVLFSSHCAELSHRPTGPGKVFRPISSLFLFSHTHLEELGSASYGLTSVFPTASEMVYDLASQGGRSLLSPHHPVNTQRVGQRQPVSNWYPVAHPKQERNGLWAQGEAVQGSS